MTGTTAIAEPVDYALAYARKGFAVFPCWPVLPSITGGTYICKCGSARCTDQGKHPAGRLVPNGLRDATAIPEQIEHLWRGMPDANIGVALDKGQCVLDVDPRHGGDGELEELCRQHGELPDTWQVKTGGGGRHYYFSIPADVTIKNSNGAVAPGVDLKTIGGYVIAPPSTHVSGTRYSWHPDHHPNKIKIAPMPDWLLALATKRNKATVTTSSEAWCDLVRAGVGEGRRNSTICRLAGHLMRRRVDPFVVLELMLCWNVARCDPPLDADEVTAVVNSVAGLEMKRRTEP